MASGRDEPNPSLPSLGVGGKERNIRSRTEKAANDELGQGRTDALDYSFAFASATTLSRSLYL